MTTTILTEIEPMNAVKIVAVILIATGTLGLVYGGFSYTKETHKVDVGPINMSIEEKERVNVPLWAGIGAIAVGERCCCSGARMADALPPNIAFEPPVRP